MVNKRRAIVLTNLGTPEAATAPAVRAFLRRFLSDPRVVEIPRPLWWLILHCFVLPLRCKRVATSYASIWMDEGSPLKLFTQRLTIQLKQRVDANTEVVYAMTYSEPFLDNVLDQLVQKGVEDIFVLPLYPQYSATTTAAVFDQVANYLKQRRDVPALYLHKDYHDHADYITALAQSVLRHREVHPPGECLLFSFHGIPKANVEKGDPYEKQCIATARLVAEALGLDSQQWQISFQSRFGRAEWLQPYTVDVLQQLANEAVSVDVISPAFATDCLETLEEMNIENRHIYAQAGGPQFSYIPCLNDDPAHADLMFRIVTSHQS